VFLIFVQLRGKIRVEEWCCEVVGSCKVQQVVRCSFLLPRNLMKPCMSVYLCVCVSVIFCMSVCVSVYLSVCVCDTERYGGQHNPGPSSRSVSPSSAGNEQATARHRLLQVSKQVSPLTLIVALTAALRSDCHCSACR